MIVFDEIGLAEISPHNPLKVLHEQLEDEQIKVAFIGISNWRLDASKMNRALYLARPDPDGKELIFTANCIYQKELRCQNYQHIKILEQLSITYLKFTNYFKNTGKHNIENIYGLRDFYHMIQMVSYEFQQGKGNELETQLLDIVKMAIERNFDGNLEALTKIQELFVEERGCRIQYNRKPIETLLLIQKNLTNKLTSRYLMIVTSGDSESYILDEFLEKELKNHRVLFCSPFNEEDEDYQIQILSDIILYLEKGVSITLRGHEKLYPSLYDLFNQSFVFSGEKRRCRIALGGLFNPNCLVHDDFHCTIIMDEKEMKNQDAPFLNRFEKHYFSMKAVLNPDQEELVRRLLDWLRTITTLRDDIPQKSLITRKHAFLGLSDEKIMIAVYQKAKENISGKRIIEEIKEQIISLSTPDFIILSKLSKLPVEEWEIYYQIYIDTHSLTLKDIIRQSCDNNQNLLVIYTYSQNISKTKIEQKLQLSINECRLSAMETESDFKMEINEFIKGEKDVLFIIVDFCEQNNYLSYLKHFLDTFKDLLEKYHKKICLIAQLTRNYINMEKLSTPLFYDWNESFVEDLTSSKVSITLNKEKLLLSTEKLLSQNVKRVTCYIAEHIEECFYILKYHYNMSNTKLKRRMNEKKNRIIEILPQNDMLIECFKQKIMTTLDNCIDWKITMITNKEIYINSKTIKEAIDNSIMLPVHTSLTKLLFTIEKYSALTSLFTELTIKSQELNRQIWIDYFMIIYVDIQVNTGNIAQSLITPLNFDLKFPFSKREFDIVQEDIRKAYYNKILSKSSLFSEFSKLTILGKHIGKLSIRKSLLKNYFEDLLYLLLQDLYLETETYCLTLFGGFIIHCSSFKTKSFKDFLLFFIEGQDLFILLLKLLKDCSLFFREGTKIEEWLNSIFQEISENPFKTIKDFSLFLLNHIIQLVYPQHLLEKQFTSDEINIKFGQIREHVRILETSKRFQIDEDKLDRLNFWYQISYIISRLSIEEKRKIKYLQKLSKAYNLCSDIMFYSDDNKCFLDIVDNILEFKEIPQINELKSLVMKYKAIKAISCIKNNTDKIYAICILIETENLYEYIGYELASFLCKNGGVAGNIQNTLENPDLFLLCIEDMISFVAESRTKNLFSTYLLNYFCNEYYFTHSTLLQNFNDNFATFQLFVEEYSNLELSNATYQQLERVKAKGYIYSYLNAYARIIYNLSTKTRFDAQLNQVFNENPELREYTFETIKFIGSLYKNREIIKYIRKNQTKFEWMKEEKARYISIVNTPISHFPMVFDKMVQKYTIQAKKILDITDNLEPFLETSCNDWRGGLSVLLALIQICVPLHWDGSADSKTQLAELRNYMNYHNDRLMTTFGEDIVKFAFLIIDNFNRDYYLSIQHEEDKEIEEIHNKLFVLSFLSIIISLGSKKVVNSYSSLYFKDGIVPGQFSELFNNMYPPGTSEDYIIHHLKLRKDPNINSFQFYQCSEMEKCPYIYIIGNCGQPYVMDTCPFCGNIIGGKDHKLYEREGHRQIPKTEIDAVITARVNFRNTQIPRGYSRIALPNHSLKEDTAREVQYFTHRILHLFLHISLDYFGKYYEEQELERILLNKPGTDPFEKYMSKQDDQDKVEGIDIHKYLTDHIKIDFTLLEKFINRPSDQSQFWKYLIISILPQFLERNSTEPDNFLVQNKFEKNFEKEISDSYNNIELSSKKYQIEWNNFLKLGDLRTKEDAPPAHLLKVGNYQDLEKIFLDGKHQEKFPILHFYILYHEYFETDKSLLSIVQFSNYMREKYNLKITREAAQEMKIKEAFLEVGETKLKYLFENFVEAWKNANFGPTLNFTCHRDLKNIKEFTEEYEIIYFLLDTLDNGYGLYMAASIYTLGQMHNQLIEEFENLLKLKYPSYTSIKRSIPIQQLTELQAINFKQSIDERACNNAFTDLEFSTKIIYNYEEIEKIIINELLGKPKLDIGDGEFIQIQYQSEINSTLVEDSRNAIKQQPLQRAHIAQLDDFLIAQKAKGEHYLYETLRTIIGGLETILIYINQATEEQKAVRIISEFIEVSHIPKHMLPEIFRSKDTTPILMLEVEYIGNLYEYLEEKYYIYYKKLFDEHNLALASEKEQVNIIMKKYLMSEEISFLYKKYNEGNLDMKLGKIIKEAVIRLIMRTFRGDIRYEEPIFRYLQYRTEVWPEIIEEDDQNILATIPENILQKHAFFVVDFLSDENNQY